MDFCTQLLVLYLRTASFGRCREQHNALNLFLSLEVHHEAAGICTSTMKPTKVLQSQEKHSVTSDTHSIPLVKVRCPCVALYLELLNTVVLSFCMLASPWNSR